MAFVGWGWIAEPDPPDDFGRSVTASVTDTAAATMRIKATVKRSFSFDFDFGFGLLCWFVVDSGSGSGCAFGLSLP